MTTHSAVYEGWVRHRRFLPHARQFQHKLFMMYLDLDELPELFRGNPLWSIRNPLAPGRFRRADYLGDRNVPLKQAVYDLVEKRTDRRPDGPVRMLTHMRYLGYTFNPVSFYYCYDRDDTQVETVVAEINNTPWNERYSYVLQRPGPGDTLRFEMEKVFHVSPFFPMDMQYAWRFTRPDSLLAVHMENHQDQRKHFDATLRLERRELSTARLNGLLVRYPLLTVKITAAIYLHALKLWLKKTPFYTHPDKLPAESGQTSAAMDR
ncbi:MAG: DUF1365 domain-containing protein [Acidobacteriota bacterium]|nr:DUF1365 domain-containing protein [Acidobacteriota bacterium]